MASNAAAMSSGRVSSLTSSSPFASMAPEGLLEGGIAGAAEDAQNTMPLLEDTPVDVLEDFGEVAVYEDDADLDPLSAMEKYCRSDLPQQRLAYAAGMGAAVELMQPHEVSGTMVSLLRELLGDVYADVRLTALQQVLPIVLRLRSAGSLYQHDIETLWDLVQKLLLDADVENQEAASSVLAELSHEVAKGNAVAASQKLVLAVQKLQRLPTELQAEGGLASLRLIAEVVAPREGSPLTFATIEEFCVSAFKSMIASDASPDVRQAVALLLPRFARHMPPALRASLLPGWIKTLAADTHWNVRAEVPQLLVNLLTPRDQQQQQQSAPAAEGGSDADGEGGRFSLVAGYAVISRWGKARAGQTAAAAGSVADSCTLEDLRLLCEVTDRLCKDTSLQVEVAALASLGQLLPLLPASLVTSQKPPLLAHFASTARPNAQLAGVKVPAALCAPRLSGHLAATRHRQRQQRRLRQRAAEAREASYQQAVQELVQEADASVQSELKGLQQGQAQEAGAAADGAGTTYRSADDPQAAGSSVAALAGAGEQAGDAAEPWVLRTASDTPVGVDDATEGSSSAAAAAAAPAGSAAAGDAPAASSAQQQQQQAKPPAAAPGTAGAELPCACALYLGKVVLHAGPDCWQQLLQTTFLELAAAAVTGDCDVAAALLLAFPDLSAALGHQEAATILVPVVLELLHTRLDALAPVLSVTLLDVVSALAPELRICLLQTLPNMALQIDSELAGDWRARLAIAQQLAAVAATVSSAQVAYCLWPLLLSLARDPVFSVRAAAAQQAGPLLAQLPEVEQPPEQGDEQKAAAAAAAPRAAQDEQQHSASVAADEAAAAATAAQAESSLQGAAGSGSGSADAGAEEAEEAEHAIAAVVATRAVSASGSISTSSSRASSGTSTSSAEPQQEQQQQQQEPGQQQQQGAAGQRLRWVRRGLTSGLYQLQQQVDKVMESPGLQKVVNGVDQQLTWLQQHPQGKVLWDIGSKLVRGAADASGGGADEQDVTVDELRQQLTSLQVMESAELDPCRFLATPAWHALAADLLPLGGSNCSERLVFVVAAGSILSAQRQQGRQQQQQQGGGGETFLQQLLRQLQQLSGDPTPGVRCAVAAVMCKLLSQGAFKQDLPVPATNSSSTDSIHSAGTGSTTASSSTGIGKGLAGGSSCSGGSPGAAAAVQQGAETQGCSGGGVSSVSSSGVLSAPVTALGILQDCLQRLQLDACASVAEAAKCGGGVGVGGPAGGDAEDAGIAVAAAAAADAAMASGLSVVHTSNAGGGAQHARSRVGDAADLL